MGAANSAEPVGVDSAESESLKRLRKAWDEVPPGVVEEITGALKHELSNPQITLPALSGGGVGPAVGKVKTFSGRVSMASEETREKGDEITVVKTKTIGAAITKKKSFKNMMSLKHLMGDSGSGEGKRKTIHLGSFSNNYDLKDDGHLATGNQGFQVRIGTEKATGREVVVKIRSKKESFRSKTEEKLWRNTTEFMLNLHNSGTMAQIIEVIEDKTNYYIVMEKVRGEDLFEATKDRKQRLLPVNEVKEIICQILSGLDDLHTLGRIHKDVKLENVMIDRMMDLRVTEVKEGGSKSPPGTPTGSRSPTSPKSPLSVKLIDFDTVEKADPNKKAKDVLGTDQYIAPEAYAGNYSPASDIFAVGVVAYRLLTGRWPFMGDIFDDQPGENWVGSPKMKEIEKKLRKYPIRWTYKAFEDEPRACDLIRSMLAMNVENRPTALQALSHPWLQSVNAEHEEPQHLQPEVARCKSLAGGLLPSINAEPKSPIMGPTRSVSGPVDGLHRVRFSLGELSPLPCSQESTQLMSPHVVPDPEDYPSLQE